jgi:kynurenine formamidase
MFERVRLIDLSVPLESGAVSEPMPPTIRYATHDGEGLRQMQNLLGIRPEDLVMSGGLGWAVEEVQAITHTGTHVDAPYHYGPTSEGRPARRIDEVPLEWCFAPGVVLDVRHKTAGEEITVADLQTALERIGHELRPLDIVLLQTGADSRLDSRDYFAQPGLGRAGVLWLVERGVKVIGIDAYTLDRPFAAMMADYYRTGDGRFIWPAHFAGITREYCQIEKLANLDQLPRPSGFTVSIFPVKIQGASAGWCRAVAIVEEDGGALTPILHPDRDLVRLVERWDRLPEAIRRAVKALIESAGEPDGGA